MSRYSLYFLAHTIGLEDHYCQYYVQDARWCHDDIFEVPCMQFFHEEEAEQWLRECIAYNPEETLTGLRRYLSDDGRQGYSVYRMNDDAVMRAVARELALHGFKVVIRPKHGVAVEIADNFAGNGFPLGLYLAPDLDTQLSTLAKHLEALVHDQQHRTASLLDLPAEDRTEEIEAAPGQLARAVTAFPGFHPSLIRELTHIGQAPVRICATEQQASISNGRGHLHAQVEKVATALHSNREQALACCAMLTPLLTDFETMQVVQDFAQRHLTATHAHERGQLGISTPADMVTALVLALALMHSGRAEAIVAQSPILAKASGQLQLLACALKSIEPRQPPAKKDPAASEAAVPSKALPAALRSEPVAHWIEIVLLDDTGLPAKGMVVSATGPDGKVTQGVTGPDGRVRFDPIEAGHYDLALPEIDADFWR
jgi:hypothetical protein